MINNKLKDLPMMRTVYEDHQLDLDYSLTSDIAVTSRSLDISFKVIKKKNPLNYPDPEYNLTNITAWLKVRAVCCVFLMPAVVPAEQH